MALGATEAPSAAGEGLQLADAKAERAKAKALLEEMGDARAAKAIESEDEDGGDEVATIETLR
eukprot:9617463-Alexandrium_andersonii.AAC.1